MVYITHTILKGANTMTTFHALQRTKERTGFNHKASERLIANAITRGKGAQSFAAKEREYLERQESKKGYWTIVYNSLCFIFSNDGVCITVYKLPPWFGKKQYDGKQVIRNNKKYIRYNDLYELEDMDYGFSKAS